MSATLTPDPPAAGEPATAVITVRNDGRGPVSGLQLTDEPSPGAIVRSGSSPAGGCDVSSGRADCPLGDLAPGRSTTARVGLLLDPEPASRTVAQRITLSAAGDGGEELVANRSFSTLVENPPQEAQVLGVPGTVVTLVAFVGFVFAAGNSRPR